MRAFHQKAMQWAWSRLMIKGRLSCLILSSLLFLNHVPLACTGSSKQQACSMQKSEGSNVRVTIPSGSSPDDARNYCAGYRGVIYGHDLECSAPEGWQQQMKIDSLPEGRKQPFYHVLVDVRDRPGGMSTYVAQENMSIQPTPRPVLHPWTNMVRRWVQTQIKYAIGQYLKSFSIKTG